MYDPSGLVALSAALAPTSASPPAEAVAPTPPPLSASGDVGLSLDTGLSRFFRDHGGGDGFGTTSPGPPPLSATAVAANAAAAAAMALVHGHVHGGGGGGGSGATPSADPAAAAARHGGLERLIIARAELPIQVVVRAARSVRHTSSKRVCVSSR